MKVAIIGYGWVGKAYHKMFPDALIYDEPQKICKTGTTFPSGLSSRIDELNIITNQRLLELDADSERQWRQDARIAVNDCDLALICVPTNSCIVKDDNSISKMSNGVEVINPHFELDMSIVDDVVNWLETPLILIKSALQPGTVDRLVRETGKKIAVSVEMVGEGKYFVPYWKYPDAEDPTKHNFLIVGGEDETARRCADFIWSKMSPDINIHLTTAIEAEVTKLMENTWGAMKVTFANTMYDICQDLGANYTRVLQAWGADGRTEKMHMRVAPGKRGWKSKCYDKDVPALGSLDKSGFIKSVIKTNAKHLNENIL